MKKADRQRVFDKFNGHCAYCGCLLEGGWHVDELLPVIRIHEYNKNTGKFRSTGTCRHPERLKFDNQMPSCPSCNINKHSMSLEQFRELIKGFMHHLNHVNTQYKIAKRYGLVTENDKDVIFYFESYHTNSLSTSS